MTAKKESYFELLRDPKWQRKRLEIMQRDEFRCRSCFNAEATLNVHHKQYFKGRKPWEYENEALVTLCETCHEEQGNTTDAIKLMFSKLPVDGPCSASEALALIAGWADGQVGLDLGEFIGCSPNEYLLGRIVYTIDKFLGITGAMRLVRHIQTYEGFCAWEENLKKFLESIPKEESK